MPKVREILSKRWDEIEEYKIDLDAVDYGDKSTISDNYKYGDVRVVKGEKSYNIEVKGTGWVAKNQGLEENGKREIDFYAFLVKGDSELWVYPYKQIKDLFQKVKREDPDRFNRELGSFSKLPGIKIHLISELPKPFRVWK